MPTKYMSNTDGPRVTVNALLKNPLAIPQRMLSMLEHQFIMESVLRRAGKPESGVIQYVESNPMFADDPVEIVAEGGEIPLGGISTGEPKVAHTVKRALGLDISIEMRDRNNMDKLNIGMEMIKNSMVKTWDGVLFNGMNTLAGVNTLAVATPWATSTTLRKDLISAAKLVNESSDANGNYFGFKPDTLILPTSATYDIMKNDDYAKNFEQNPLAAENVLYTGKLQRRIQEFTILESRTLAAGTAYLVQRGVMGGFADERPMGVTSPYEIKSREMWRADCVRRTGIFFDQPKAICKITGI